MIGLDTNVLVRYLTQDDLIQSKLANKIINHATEQGELLWIGHVTLCETIWVLERAYKVKKETIVEILHLLLQTQELVFEHHDIVWQALQDYKSCPSVGFADCLIGRQNLSNQCAFTYTFDKEAAKELSTFHLLK
ncbi:MAG: PIN domain-containing protein [Chlamydiales bacterium]